MLTGNKNILAANEKNITSKFFFRIGCRQVIEASETLNNISNESYNEISVIDQTSSFTEQLSKKRKLSSGFVKHFAIDKMSGTEKHSVDLRVVQFIIGCDIPHDVVESPHFQGMITALRYSYKPPKENEVAGDLLDELYEELLAMKVSSKTETGTLLVNGSKRNEVTVFVKPRNQSERFVKSYQVDDNLVDTISSVIQSAIRKAQALYNIQCDSLCIDNRGIVRSLTMKFKNMSIYSCKFEMLEELETLLIDEELINDIYHLVTQVLNDQDLNIPDGTT